MKTASNPILSGIVFPTLALWLSAVVGTATPPHLQPVLEGKCPEAGPYFGIGSRVHVVSDFAYVPSAGVGGLQVIDVSDPTNCVWVAGYGSSGSASARAVYVAGNRIYVADYDKGLLVLCSVPNVQFTVRVDATPGEPFTIEAASSLNPPVSWSTVFTTNSATMPAYFVDSDVKQSEKPQKFYRVHQP
jgi:hypothetical protein